MRWIFLLAALLPAAAVADSCWNHNGSIMRLIANGQNRIFVYEHPRPELRSAGVTEGTMLFNGVNDGGWYSGYSRVFSSACPANPLEYVVAGPVSNGQRRVTMQGTRQIHQSCMGTGQFVTDVLVFDYAYQC